MGEVVDRGGFGVEGGGGPLLVGPRRIPAPHIGDGGPEGELTVRLGLEARLEVEVDLNEPGGARVDVDDRLLEGEKSARCSVAALDLFDEDVHRGIRVRGDEAAREEDAIVRALVFQEVHAFDFQGERVDVPSLPDADLVEAQFEAVEGHGRVGHPHFPVDGEWALGGRPEHGEGDETEQGEHEEVGEDPRRVPALDRVPFGRKDVDFHAGWKLGVDRHVLGRPVEEPAESPHHAHIKRSARGAFYGLPGRVISSFPTRRTGQCALGWLFPRVGPDPFRSGLGGQTVSDLQNLALGIRVRAVHSKLYLGSFREGGGRLQYPPNPSR